MTERAEQPWREAPTRSGIDASNFYKNAFVLFDRLSEEEKKMIRQPREEVDAEKAAALFEKVRAILDLLREAAKAEYCDWGQAPYTFDTPMPQIGKAQDLGKLGLWAAAYQFSNNPAAAFDVLADRATLGHHIADTLIGVLVETSFEVGAHELLLQHAGGFDTATAARAREVVQASKVDEDVARAFEAEIAGSTAMGRQLLAMSEPERMKMIGALTAGGGDEESMKRIYGVVTDPVRLAAEIAFIAEMNKATAAALALPEAEFQAYRRSMEGRVNDEHPMAQLILPSYDSVQKSIQKVRVQRTMLDAGLAVMQGGPGQLANYRDPATSRSFTYVPTPAGFELRSAYQVKGKPVTMSFPAPR